MRLILCQCECSLVLPESLLGGVTCHPAHLHPLLLVSRAFPLTFPALCSFAPSLTLPRFPKCQLIGHCHPLREPLPVWTLSLARVVRHFDRGGKAVSTHKMGKREAGGGVVRLWWMLDGGYRHESETRCDARGTVTCLIVPVY